MLAIKDFATEKIGLSSAFRIVKYRNNCRYSRHDYQKHRNASARDLSDRRGNPHVNRTRYRHHHWCAGTSGRNLHPDRPLGVQDSQTNSIICLALAGYKPEEAIQPLLMFVKNFRRTPKCSRAFWVKHSTELRARRRGGSNSRARSYPWRRCWSRCRGG